MKRILLLYLGSILLLPSCTGLAVGAGATAGVATVQEGGISRAISDFEIQAQINDLWFREDIAIFSKLDLTVNQGRVLITGVVQDPGHRVEAVRLAWQPNGVKQVINEIQVAESDGLVGFARDTWISTRLRTAITLDREIQSINYSIDTVKGIVYLMGVAQNQAELNKVIEIARTIPDVDRVVSYVKFAGELLDSEDVTKAPVDIQGGSSGSQPEPIQWNGQADPGPDPDAIDWGEDRQGVDSEPL